MTTKFKDLFISYGRRESLGFVGRLHKQLKLAGYDGWFDKVNIPDGEDYTQRINHGIESAHNFVYVMSPRCMTSLHCLLELEYARILGKRVIPINQMVIFETDSKKISETDKQVLVDFYKFHNQLDQNIQTTQDILNRSHELIGRTDWLAAQEKLSDIDCQQLVEWAEPYENNWSKHDNLEYLKQAEIPIFGRIIDKLSGVVESIIKVIERHKNYVHKHTEILADALWWKKNQRTTPYLLVVKERTSAEEWLLTDFLPPKQPPCKASELMCEFICESRKNAENMMTDIFICYDVKDKEIRDSVVKSLSNYAKTTWRHDYDIQKTDNYECSIEQGIENADNFFYFISPYSVTSKFCNWELQHALKYNKRIVPLLITETPENDIPEVVHNLQYIDFTDNTCQIDYDSDIDDILNILRHEQEYYKQHKVLLVRALKWKITNQKVSFLLRGHNLDNSRTWLRLNSKREKNPPLELHKEFITASEASNGTLNTEVFISYSRKNSDFARQLNIELQEVGKTTWFDQESISTGVDFEKEIFKGIENSDNFVFIISPDSVKSEYCEQEVNYAIEHNKRLISILHHETNSIPIALQKINWIDFTNNNFDKSFLELIQTIDLDREHIHKHTILQQRAIDWIENNKSRDFLLNVTACKNAEIWQNQAVIETKEPAPTELQQEFIRKSRKAIKKARRKQLFSGIIMSLAIIAIVATGFAINKMYEARNQAQLALVEKLGAIINNHLPNSNNGSYEQALLLAAQAFKEKEDSTVAISNLLRVFQATKQHDIFLYGHFEAVTSLAFSPNKKIMASASKDNTIRLWNIKEKRLFGEPLIGHFDEILSIDFSKDGKYLASASKDSTVRLWDVATQKSFGQPLTRHSRTVKSVTFSPDGKILASAADDNSIIFWDFKQGKLLSKLYTNFPINNIIFSPNGKILASANIDATIQLWDVKTRKKLGKPLVKHSKNVISVAFHPDGNMLASGSEDKAIIIWDIHTRKPIGKPLIGHSDDVNSVVFSHDGKLLASASRDRNIKLWDVESGKQYGETLKGHFSYVNNIAFSADGKFLASAGEDKTIRLWNIAPKNMFNVADDWINSIAFSPNDSTIALASEDNTIKLWDVKTKQLVNKTLVGHSKPVTSVAFNHTGNILASASRDNTIRLWDVKTKKTLGMPLNKHTQNVTSIAFHPEENILASASDDKTIILWDIETKTMLGEPLYGHDDSIYNIVFSSNGKFLASASEDKTIKLWYIKTEKPSGNFKIGKTAYKFLTTNFGFVTSLSFTPNGKILAAGNSNGSITLWNTQSKKVLANLTGHHKYISSVTFDNDGNMLASASWDNTIRLWDIKTQKQLGEAFKGHSKFITDIAFNSDGKILASSGYDKTLRLWEINPEVWFKQACKISNRNLTQKEWNEYVGRNLHEKTCPNLPTDTLGALEHIKKARNLVRNNETKEVLKKYNQAFKLDPNQDLNLAANQKQIYSTILIEQGYELIKEQNLKAAVTAFKRVLKHDDNFNLTSILDKQGQNLAKEGRIEDAITLFDEALKLSPDLPFKSDKKAKQIYGAVLARQGRNLAINRKLSEATKRFEKAMKIGFLLPSEPQIMAEKYYLESKMANSLVEQDSKPTWCSHDNLIEAETFICNNSELWGVEKQNNNVYRQWKNSLSETNKTRAYKELLVWLKYRNKKCIQIEPCLQTYKDRVKLLNSRYGKKDWKEIYYSK